MDLDDLQFEKDEDRRKYLADLAKLKRYREEAKNHRAEGPWVPQPDRDTDGEMPLGQAEAVRRIARRSGAGTDRKGDGFLPEGGIGGEDVYCPDNDPDGRDESLSGAVPDEEDGYEEGEYGDEEEGRPRRKRHILPILLFLVFAAGAAYFAYAYFFTPRTGFYTVAVFGVDSRDGNVGKGALADVNILAQVDRASGEIRLVSVYRDTYVQIREDRIYHKLNEAYFRGGPEQAIWALEHNLDVKTDDYATFNWKAIVDAVNILGGIDLEISEPEFAYINGFITETVNSTGVGSVQLEHAGMNHLDGVQAVAYARLRLMDTDYQRTERQRKVVMLAFEKAKQADLKTLRAILVTVLPQINTSITVDDMLPFARSISKYHIADTCGFPFDRVEQDVADRVDCVVPVTMESNVVKLHEFLRPGESYTPSAQVHAISEHIREVSGR